MYRLICQKPAHFLSAQMALVSTFFQMFIVLGMYNFGLSVKLRQNSSIFSQVPKIPKFITFSLLWPFATFVSVLFNQHKIPQKSSNKQEEQAKSRFQNWKQFAIFHLPRATGFCKGGGQGCTLIINPEIRIGNIVPYSREF